MKPITLRSALMLCFFLVFPACHTKQDGVVEGSVLPPSSGVHITVSQSGKPVCAVDAGVQDGKFRIALSPGKYDISINAPASPFPVTFSDVTVVPGKASTLPPVAIAQRTGLATLSGTVLPSPALSKITLQYEGSERATVNTDADGKYEFSGLPSGTYTLLASSAGYADDKTEVRIVDDHNVAQNMRLFYMTEISGVDWGRGTIRAKGIGMLPTNGTNRTVARELAKRAALSEAERNLLRIVEQIKLDPNHEMRSLMNEEKYTVKINGFLKGFTIVAEKDVDDGVEVELELPLTGLSGLTRYLTD
jgi:hypothetical protein